MDISKMDYNKIEELDFNSLINVRYKSWKEFCTKNNIKYSDSTSSRNSLKNKLEKYCKVKYIKNSKEFIIKEVYEIAKPTKSKQGKDGKFATHIEYLLRYLPQNQYMSMTKIQEELMLITKDYTKYNFSRLDCVHEIMYQLNKPYCGTKEFGDETLFKIVNNFFMQTGFIKGSIKRKLLNLQKNNVIKLDIKRKIVIGDLIRFATKEENEYIDKAEKEVLEELGMNEMDIYLKNKYDEFNHKVQLNLMVHHIILDRYFQAYKFEFLDTKTGKIPSDKTILARKLKLRKIYIDECRNNFITESNKNYIKYICKYSHSFYDIDEITSHLNNLCDFLLCSKPYEKYNTHDNIDLDNNICDELFLPF